MKRLISRIKNSSLDNLLSIILILLITPFTVLFAFIHPTADDFCFAFLSKAHGFFGTIIYFYNTWTGRYASTGIMSLQPLNFNSEGGYKIMGLLMFIFLLGSIFIFIRTISRKYLKLSGQLIISLAVILFYLIGMPSLAEGFYWMSATATYHVGNAFLLLFATILIKLFYEDNKRKQILYGVGGLLTVMIAVGANEISMFFLCGLSFLSFVISFILKSKNKKFYFLFFISALIFSAVVYFAPGNTVRMNAIIPTHTPHDLIFSLKSSVESTIFNFKSFWKIDLIPFALIVAYIAFPVFYKNKFDLKKLSIITAVLSIICLGFIWIVNFPNFWLIGDPPNPRTLNIAYFVFIFLCLCWATYLSFLASIFVKKHTEIKYMNLLKLVLLVLIILGFLIAFKSHKPSENYETALKDIVTGEAYNYNKQRDARNQLIINTPKGSTLTIDKITNIPRSIFMGDITPLDTDWTNNCYELNYDMVSVKTTE